MAVTPSSLFRRRSLLSDLWALYRYRELLRNLIAKDLKVKYRNSLLGFLWSLLNPLLLILVYVLAFRVILRVPLENYPLFLVSGLLHWQFFSACVSASANVLIAHTNLLQSISFPRIILPLSIVGSQFIQFALAMGAFAAAYIPLGGQLWWGLILYPVSALLLLIFVTGVSLGISALAVFYRDLQHLVEVGLRLLFWLTPIVYNFTRIPESIRPLFRLNPMVSFIIPYHELLYLNELPSLGNWVLMLIWAVGILGLGYLLFKKLEARFVEVL
jgi:ABC-type polysaccharide/polyol phosphate export permease